MAPLMLRSLSFAVVVDAAVVDATAGKNEIPGTRNLAVAGKAKANRCLRIKRELL